MEEFHDTDTDILARMLADSPQRADIPAKIFARMSVSVSWNAGFYERRAIQILVHKLHRFDSLWIIRTVMSHRLGCTIHT